MDGQDLGTVAETSREFSYKPKKEPSVLTIQSEKYKTARVFAIVSRPESVYEVKNIKYDLHRTNRPIFASISCVNEGMQFVDGELQGTDARNFQAEYPRTKDFWHLVVSANEDAKKRMGEFGMFTLYRSSKEVIIAVDLNETFASVDDSGVDPELIAAFKDVREFHKSILKAREAVENGWDDACARIGFAVVGEMIKLGVNGNTDGGSLFDFPSLAAELGKPGDVYTLLWMGYARRLQTLNAVLQVMEYRYNDKFQEVDPVYKNDVLVAISTKLRDTLKEDEIEVRYK